MTIIFLYGQDNFRSRSKLNEFKEKYLREIDKSGGGLNVLSGDKADFSEIAGAVGSSSLLSKKRLIVIEDIFANKDAAVFEKLEEYLKSRKQCDNIIIFWDRSVKIKKIKNIAVPALLDSSGKETPLNKKQSGFFKFLSAQKYAFSFNLMSNAESVGWIKKLSAARGAKISNKAAESLAYSAGNDGWRISNELDKLISYKAAGMLVQDGGSIEYEDVKNLASAGSNENIFALTDALSVKNRALAVQLFEEQLEAGLSGGHLLAMFARQFKILLQTKQALESGLSRRQIASQFKLHAFVVQKAAEQARNFTLSALKSVLVRLAEIDFKVKSGASDYITELHALMVGIR